MLFLKKVKTYSIILILLTVVMAVMYTDVVQAGSDSTSGKFFEEVYNGDAADYIIEQLLSREKQVCISFPYDSPEINYDLIQELFENAIDHYGPGDWGDYIRYQLGSWNYNASIESGNDGSYITKVTYNVDFYTTAAQEKMVAQKVDEIANQLDLANIGEYEACYAIYKYITSHVKYDDEHVDDDSYTLKYTAYAALFNGKAVCQGYSACLL